MIRIVRKSTLDEMKDDIQDYLAEICRLSCELSDAQEENKRLFDQHNRRLTKPKPDKNGVLRDNNGRFAKK